MESPSDEQEISTTIRRRRLERAIDQRDTAELAGVSISALRRLESGQGSTLRTFLAVCSALGLELSLGADGAEPASVSRSRVSSPTRGRARLERREDRVALELHRAVVRRLRAEPEHVRQIARRNLPALRENVRGDVARAWINEWARALDAPTPVLVELCLREDEHGIDMRQVGPFLGVLDDDERLAAISKAKSS